MNSTFSLRDDDDLSSYDIGIASLPTDSESLDLKQYGISSDNSDVTIYFEPNLCTHQIDTLSKESLPDVIEHLYVEPYYITISSRPYDPRIDGVKKGSSYSRRTFGTSSRNIDDNEDQQICVEASDLLPEVVQTESRTNKSTSKRISSNHPTTEKKVITERVLPPKFDSIEKQIIFSKNPRLCIPVRLKSGEEFLMTKPVFAKLRDLSKQSESLVQANGIEIQSVSKPNIIHVPFTDRLSGAIAKLDSDGDKKDLSKIHDSKSLTTPVVTKQFLSNQRIDNGKITKTVKLRAALDKSSVAWASTTRLKPKTSLQEHLKLLTANANFIQDSKNNLTNSKIIPTEKPISKLSKPPVVIRLTSKIPNGRRQMTTLSNALKKIASDEIFTHEGLNTSQVNGIV